MPFEKGNNANPDGRGKKSEHERRFERACLEYSDESLETIVEIMRADDCAHKTRLSAAQYLIDRAYGKARQSVEHTGELRHKIARELSDAELAEIAAKANG